MQENQYNRNLYYRRRFAHFVARRLYHLGTRHSVEGQEKIPDEPVLFAFNHNSVFDMGAIVASLPPPLEGVAAEEIWEEGSRLLIRFYSPIYLRRNHLDRRVIRQVKAALAQGYSVGISPEGYPTHGKLVQGLPGLGFISLFTQTPILPLAHWGTEQLDYELPKWFRFNFVRPVTGARIGDLIYPPPIAKSPNEVREQADKLVDEVMLALAALLPENYRGIYAERVPTP